MRFRNGLALFERTNSWGRWNLASFHSPHSLTWSWILSFDLPRRGGGRWLYVGRWRKPRLEWTLFVARFRLGWQTQEPMWYRNMYRHLSEKAAIAEGRMWPGPAYRAPPVPPPILPGSTSVN